MPIILQPKQVVLASDYFKNSLDAIKATELKDEFRILIGDEDASKNILDNQEFSFNDGQIYGFLRSAINDINAGIPRTAYTISGIRDDLFVVKGAIVMALVAKGILESRNSLNFSDQGVSINTYDKGPNYQSWANNLNAEYNHMKMQYKQAEVYRNMFTGIRSDYYGL